jgi:hypothetical protein
MLTVAVLPERETLEIGRYAEPVHETSQFEVISTALCFMASEKSTVTELGKVFRVDAAGV